MPLPLYAAPCSSSRSFALRQRQQGPRGITVNHYVFGGQIALSVGTQIVPVGANNFASVTGGLVSSGIMSAAMRVSAGSGFAPSSLPKVDGAEDEAKQAVMNSTVATFSA